MYDYITYGSWEERFEEWDYEHIVELESIDFENHLKTGYYDTFKDEKITNINHDIFYQSEYLESFDTEKNIDIFGFRHI